MAEKSQFTAAEAAFVLREPVRNVTKAFDRGPVRPSLRIRSGAPLRVIDWADLLYLFAVRTLRADLTPKARGELHAALRRARPGQADEVGFGRFRVALADMVDEMNRRTAELRTLRGTLADDGKAIRGTRGVEVHRIAALLNGGLSVNAIREEYPWLTHEAVESARVYALAHPKSGRPYPRTTANRLAREIGTEPGRHQSGLPRPPDPL